MRKVELDNGRVLDSWLASIDKVVERVMCTTDLAHMAVAQGRATGHLRQATAALREWGAGNELDTCGAATDYLRLFGLVALGAAWLRMAEAASKGRQTHPQLTPFYNGKIGTADFYFRRLLPESEWRFDGVIHGARSLMTLAPAEF
jgi:Acetyl-CoA dehydrogenase C-terminal like